MSKSVVTALVVGVVVFMAYRWWKSRGPQLTLINGGAPTARPNTDAGSFVDAAPITAEVQRLRVANAVQKATIQGLIPYRG